MSAVLAKSRCNHHGKTVRSMQLTPDGMPEWGGALGVLLGVLLALFEHAGASLLRLTIEVLAQPTAAEQEHASDTRLTMGDHMRHLSEHFDSLGAQHLAACSGGALGGEPCTLCCGICARA